MYIALHCLQWMLSFTSSLPWWWCCLVYAEVRLIQWMDTRTREWKRKGQRSGPDLHAIGGRRRHCLHTYLTHTPSAL
ncbi:hypothetical protein B0T22DRAFT_264553 [Podospora appendiculata]|uniref:Uncharacterized protein n=1 Tax=Podospora appendiculata TaxID=314037 RepID=A0AAE0X3K7_9PEZI|nr:hypothetical protein B0T22DRAFT_264553 [Podospora appendiculata]